MRFSPNSTKSTSNHANQQVSVAYPIAFLFFLVEIFGEILHF